jgi:2-oxoglutarate dehydrogenase E1 component
MRSYNSFLTTNNASQIIEIYKSYKSDKSSVDKSWIDFFKSLDPQELAIIEDYQSLNWTETGNNYLQIDSNQAITDSLKAVMIIRAYREIGHLTANLEPLKLYRPDLPSGLDPSYYGFEEKDMDRKIFLSGYLGFDFASIREVIEKLKNIYSGTFASEYKHIQSSEEYLWLKDRIENRTEMNLTIKGKRTILERLISSEIFEKFLDKKYRGSKRFGLDGSESTIPALEQLGDKYER